MPRSGLSAQANRNSLVSGARSIISGPRRRLTLPSDLPNLVAWHRFNLGITITGSGVSQWDDQSGKANHLLQAVDANRPAKQADGSILFDGVAFFLKAANFTLNQPLTVYALLRQVTWTINNLFFDGGVVATQVRQDVATPSLAMNGAIVLPGQGNLALNTYGALCCVYNSTNSAFHVNLTAPVVGDAGANNPGGFTIGAARTGAAFCNVQYKEVFVFAEAHEPGTRTRLLQYLRSL